MGRVWVPPTPLGEVIANLHIHKTFQLRVGVCGVTEIHIGHWLPQTLVDWVAGAQIRSGNQPIPVVSTRLLGVGDNLGLRQGLLSGNVQARGQYLELQWRPEFRYGL